MNEEECLECEENRKRTLNSYTSMCECEKGYTEDPKTKECIRCYTYHDNCHIGCPKSTYADDSEYVCIERYFLVKDNIILILLSSMTIIIAIIGQSLVYKFIRITKKGGIRDNDKHEI